MKRYAVLRLCLLCVLAAALLCGCTPAAPDSSWEAAMTSTGYSWGCPNADLQWGMTEAEAIEALHLPDRSYDRYEVAADGAGIRLELGKKISLFGESGHGNLLFNDKAGLFAVEVRYEGDMDALRKKLERLLGSEIQEGDEGKGKSLIWQGTPLNALAPERLAAYEAYLRSTGLEADIERFEAEACTAFVTLNIDEQSHYYRMITVNGTHASYLTRGEQQIQ